MLGRPDDIVIFFRAKAGGRNSFVSTNPYKFAVKKQRRSDGDISTEIEEADSRKDDERQSEKERIPISSNTLKVINLWGRYEHTTRQPGHTMMRWRVKVRVRDRREKPTARRGLDTDSPASFLQRP